MTIKLFFKKQQQCLDKYLTHVFGNNCLLVGSDDLTKINSLSVNFKYSCSGFVSSQAYGVMFNSLYWPFKEHSFDVIVLYHTFPKIRKPAKLMTEINHILTAGGYLVVVDFNHSILGKKLLAEYTRRYYKKPLKNHSRAFINSIIMESNFQEILSCNYSASDSFWSNILDRTLPNMAAAFLSIYQKQTFSITPLTLKQESTTFNRKYVATSGMNQHY